MCVRVDWCDCVNVCSHMHKYTHKLTSVFSRLRLTLYNTNASESERQRHRERERERAGGGGRGEGEEVYAHDNNEANSQVVL